MRKSFSVDYFCFDERRMGRDFEEMRERVMVMVFSIFRSFVIFVVIICLG